MTFKFKPVIIAVIIISTISQFMFPLSPNKTSTENVPQIENFINGDVDLNIKNTKTIIKKQTVVIASEAVPMAGEHKIIKKEALGSEREIVELSNSKSFTLEKLMASVVVLMGLMTSAIAVVAREIVFNEIESKAAL